MAMNLVRTGTAAGLGVASGVLSDEVRFPPVVIGETSISYGAIAEGVGVVIGAGLQFMSPFTTPNLADGLVDGGAALLGSRLTKWAMTQWAQPAAGAYARRSMGATRVSPNLAGHQASPQIGSVGRVPKYSNT